MLWFIFFNGFLERDLSKNLAVLFNINRARGGEQIVLHPGFKKRHPKE